MSSYLLLVVILLCFMSNGMLLEANGESCTEGFMDYSLLQDKARNPLGSLRNNRLAENTATRWIIIEDQEDENFMKRDIMFTCATVVLEILIGVDIRTVNDTVGRNLYPKFEVWAPTNDDDVYTREMSIEIRLTPDNFTTNGQYHFTLPTPLNVSSGYRIGVYQPPDHRSVVRFHYINLPSGIDGIGKVKSGRINDTNIKIAGGSKNVDHKTWYILIYPLAQNTSCFTQPMPENMNNFVSMITNSRFLYDTRIFPDIKFTCHGIITNWILTVQVTSVIKIRHTNNLTTTAIAFNPNDIFNIPPLLSNFTMSNEIAVQPGDVLMIESNSTNYMYYQQYNGPHNYRLGDNNELIALDTNDYPLISVVVEPTSFYTATSTISSTHINTVNTVLPSSSIYSTATVTMESMKYTKTSLTTSMESTVSTPVTTSQDTGSNTTLVLTENTITVSASMNSTVINTPLTTSQNTRSNTLILAGSISTAVFILLVVTILVILIVSVLVCRRIWYKTSNGNDTFSSGERKADINQQSDAPNMENTLLASANPAYGVTGERHNTDVSANPAYGVAEKSGVSANPAYGINTGGIESNSVYGVEWRNNCINEESLVYDEPRTMYHEQEHILSILGYNKAK
ncbi:PREDICTED: uncharacterized threonine-rich GPI-anchored glycoprotein PJ4664.02-like isoform X3 [Amphimedon queenslandica]|uniref:IgGFc-binding protein N-terminal domain-containing protein n=1 Tax=Amphimedon queenslandica TaxID=400682 RepID=A0AAN0JQ93_AMPQE|nr:PREDICTED: uncharacterized threonine-rich GPI-anchored glycoprotein PJ4664.02-like isoform X3 [Amphimedon queenslandica]|eukprot:XP_019858986.1 PREDICTED: uncharacterized threonine-rich GPI-anchored glycoprotein PJ4664.02-like isoform X3 [Amphimedon queenslandica]